MFDDDIGLRLLWAAGGDFRDTAITASFIGGNVEALDYLLQLGRVGDPSVRRLHYTEMEEFPEWLMHSDIGSESSFVYSEESEILVPHRAAKMIIQAALVLFKAATPVRVTVG